MSSIRLDYRFFVYVFVCFTISSLVFTGIMVYYISQFVDSHRSTWRLVVKQEDKAGLDGNLWSRDPMVMQGLADVRARGTHGTMEATLTQVISNDSCFGFVWTRFHLQKIGKYQVLITNIKLPTMTPISAVIRGLETGFVQCDLNVSTPYLVNLTAVGEGTGVAGEAASAVMWTTHHVPPPPDLPKIVSVTETTITFTLTWPTLTQGPLSALEIRIKPVATNRSSGDTNPRPLFWARFFKRHKRSSEYLQPRGALLGRGVGDSPQSLLQSARDHGIMQDRRADDVMQDRRADDVMQDRRADDVMQDRRGDKVMQDRRGDKVMQDRRADDVMQDRRGDKVMQDRRGDKVMQDRRADDVMQDRRADDVMQDRRGDKVMQDRRADKVMQDRRGDKVMQDRRADDVMQDRRADKVMQDRRGDKVMQDRRADDVMQDRRADDVMQDRRADDVMQDRPGDKVMQDRRGDKVMQDRRADDGLLKIGHIWASPQDGQAPGDYDVPHTDIPFTVVPHKVVINKDVPNKFVSNKNVPNKATVGSERHKGTHGRISNPQSRMTSEDPDQAGFVSTTNDRLVGDRQNDKVHSATVEVKQWPGQTHHKLNDTRLRSWLNNRADSFNVQSLDGQATRGDRMESKATDNGQLHRAMTNFTWPDGKHISPDGRHAGGQNPNTSDITWLEADIDPELQGMFDLSRWRVRHNLVQPASLGEDMAMLQLLAKNVQEQMTKNVQEQMTKNVQELQQPGRLSANSSLDVAHVSSLTHNTLDTGNLSAACPQCEGDRDMLEDDIKAGPSLQPSPGSTSSNTPGLVSKMAMFARTFLDMTSRYIVSRFVGQGQRAVSRQRRSILGFGRHRRQPTADDVREVEDRLDVDPYQTYNVLMSSTGQPIRVKTGYGYFVTDHYGVRHPYFNNSLLQRGLLRQARYQEARDFVLYGKSVLNLTEFKDLDSHLLYTRLGKIMEVNRVRRNKLFLDMFEDFLFWNQDRGDNQLGGTSVPHEAKLGLPPGVPVARVLPGARSQNVTIGEDTGHDQLPNPPLQPGTEYEVVIVVLSTVMNVTKHAWISVNMTTLPEQPRLVSTPVLVVIGLVAAGGLLVFVLSHLVLWLTYSRPAAPPGAGWQDVQPQTAKARTTEQAGCGHLFPGLTSYCDSGVSLIEPGGHIMDTSSWCLSAPDLRSPRRKTSSPALCDERNNTDSTNDGHLHTDTEGCDIVEVRLDAVASQRGPGQDSPQKIRHQRKLVGARLLQRAEQKPHSVFSLEEVV